MRQVTGLTATYSSDVFGVCSALYELGGMVVMHDASGCNSTYTTHDEPRWYDMDSMVFVSAISEMEAILGDDEKWIRDLTETAAELHPQFVALVLAPIPYMIGTDVQAIAGEVERRSKIPCFAFAANGMHDYTAGVSKAMEQIVRAYAAGETVASDGKSSAPAANAGPVVNLLGVTPLDFSLNGSVEAMQKWVTDHGMKNGTCLAMGCLLEDIAHMGDAQVNLVVSSGGLSAAKLLRERFGTPFVVGVPYGKEFSEDLAGVVKRTASSEENVISYQPDDGRAKEQEQTAVIIGESVTSASLAAAIEAERDLHVRVLSPLHADPWLLRPGDVRTPEEDDLIREIGKTDTVIADPLYQPLCAGKRFYPLPHTAFSGRIYEKKMPNLIAASLKEYGKIC